MEGGRDGGREDWRQYIGYSQPHPSIMLLITVTSWERVSANHYSSSRYVAAWPPPSSVCTRRYQAFESVSSHMGTTVTQVPPTSQMFWTSQLMRRNSVILSTQLALQVKNNVRTRHVHTQSINIYTYMYNMFYWCVCELLCEFFLLGSGAKM